MTLKPGCAEEYKRRHDEIWPELLEQMRDEGIRNFTIWRHDLTLFATLERGWTPDPQAEPSALTFKWWRSMAHLMETEPDASPVEKPLEEMFHVD